MQALKVGPQGFADMQQSDDDHSNASDVDGSDEESSPLPFHGRSLQQRDSRNADICHAEVPNAMVAPPTLLGRNSLQHEYSTNGASNDEGTGWKVHAPDGGSEEKVVPVVPRPCIISATNRPLNYKRFENLGESSDEADQDKASDGSDDSVELPEREQKTSQCRCCAGDLLADSVRRPLRCSKCQSAVYCSRQCQREDWRFHKRICNEASQEDRNSKKIDHAANQLGRIAAETEFKKMVKEERQRVKSTSCRR